MMKQQLLRIEAEPLRLNLKTTVRHASAVRDKGESILVQAKRNEKTGYGEGCPRVYVAGDDIDASLAWIKKNFSSSNVNFGTLVELKQWAEDNKKRNRQLPFGMVCNRNGIAGSAFQREGLLC